MRTARTAPDQDHPEEPGNAFADLAFSIPEGGVSLEEIEKNLLQTALSMASGNQTRAARLLHLTRDTLRYRMKKFGLC